MELLIAIFGSFDFNKSRKIQLFHIFNVVGNDDMLIHLYQNKHVFVYFVSLSMVEIKMHCNIVYLLNMHHLITNLLRFCDIKYDGYIPIDALYVSFK